MPTGSLHYRTIPNPAQALGFDIAECRCMVGADHLDDGSVLGDTYDDTSGDGLSVWDAADIWESNGKDEDYTFGFSSEELQQALDDD